MGDFEDVFGSVADAANIIDSLAAAKSLRSAIDLDFKTIEAAYEKI